MCPQPHVGLRLDILFEHTHILLAVAAVLAFDGRYLLQRDLIISPSHTLHAAVEEMGVQFSSHSLTTGDDGCVLVEEGHPLRFGPAWRTLVGDESKDDRSAGPYLFDDIAQSLFLRYSDRIETAAQAIHEAVHRLVAQGVIHLYALEVGMYPERDGDHILPVALMPQIEEDGAPVGAQGFEHPGIGEPQVTAHLLVGDVHELDGLEQVVAEVAVEGFLNLYDIPLALLGEGLEEVLAGHLTAVTCHMIDEGIEQAAECMQHPIGPDGQCLDGDKEQRVFHFILHVS